MANVIDADGIHIQTFAEIVAELIDGAPDVPGLKQIYGPDILVDSNTPDGQMANIFALSKKDILDLCVAIHDSFDPDQAVGASLDSISQISGLARKGGSYTITDVEVTVDRDLNLPGLDSTTQVPFTIQDATGNKFYLEVGAALTTGANVLSFRAALLGEVQILANTLTIPVTIILGVTAVNNPTAPTQTGANQESDAAFRIRRQKSVAGPAQGYLQALFSGLNDIPGMTSAVIYENVTNSSDGDGIPGHSIWVIVDGGTDAEVAEQIYLYRNAGCGMKGAEEVLVEQVDGSFFTIKFDRVTEEDLYIEFHLDAIGGSFDAEAIKAALVAAYTFTINQYADISTLSDLVRQINPNVVVSEAGVSNDDSAFPAIVYPTTKNRKFVLSAENITIS